MREQEEESLGRALGAIVQEWKARGEFQNLMVLELLFVKGWGNKDVAAQLFVSPKTVEYHLAKIFRKLGIKSRVELVKLETRDWD